MANWVLGLCVYGILLIFSAVGISIFFNQTSCCHYILAAGITILLLILGFSAVHAAALRPARSHTFSSLIHSYVVLNWLVPLLAKLVYSNTISTMRNPQRHQDLLLMKILTENGKTVFGKDHGLDKIITRKEFVESFPLTKYKPYEVYVDRIANGEQNIMTKAKVTGFCSSSGTTGKNKLYPLTKADNGLFTECGLTYLHSFLKLYKPKLLRELDFTLHHPVTKTVGGLTITGLEFTRKYKAPNRIEIAPLLKITKEGPSYFVQALFSLRESHIGFIRTASSELTYAFFKSMESNKDALCKAMASGHIEYFPELDDEIRQELNQLLSPDPERAREIQKQLEIGSEGFASRIWPDLKVTLIPKTGSFAHSTKILEATYLKNVSLVFGLHRATEAFMGISMSLPDLLREEYTFSPNTVFMEFIKEEDIGHIEPQTYLLSELQVGRSYEVVVTNWHGLYRYRFGDVIKVVGLTRNTPKYTFQYRADQVLNCAFERMPEKVFYEALKRAQTEWNVEVANYTTATIESMHLETVNDIKTQNGYVAFIETLKDETLSESHCEVLDRNLCNLYERYAICRKNGSIGLVRIIQVLPGTFDGLRSILWGSRPNAQFKTPRVLRNHQALEFLWDNRCQ